VRAVSSWNGVPRGRLTLRPVTTVGKCAVAVSVASGVGLATAFVAPDRGGWGVVGMGGAVVGLSLGLASAIPALLAVYLRRERFVSIVAAALSFGGSAYLVRRSLAPRSRISA
jgi:hypothetical protein